MASAFGPAPAGRVNLCTQAQVVDSAVVDQRGSLSSSVFPICENLPENDN